MGTKLAERDDNIAATQDRNPVMEKTIGGPLKRPPDTDQPPPKAKD
jgi:hypothetical protein